MTTLYRFLLFAAVGLLVEVLFTGLRGVLLFRDKNATCITYLWMVPVYGLAALLMRQCLATGWHWLALAPLFTLIIFGIEFVSGWLLKLLLGACPWDYGSGPWSPLGLINLRYTPFWFGLAAVFGPISRFVDRIVAQ